MQGGKRRNKTKARRRQSPEPHIGTVTFNPGPDAEDRLRSLFTLLHGLADDARTPGEGRDGSARSDAGIGE